MRRNIEKIYQRMQNAYVDDEVIGRGRQIRRTLQKQNEFEVLIVGLPSGQIRRRQQE